MSALSRPRWWLSVLLVLLIGATLRTAHLNDYPPGFHYDEAADFIISREIAFYGAHPFPMFEAYNGREVFYYYANALALRGIGESIFTARLAGAWMSWIAIAATISLGHAMFGGRRGLVVGLLAGGLLSVSFPQIFIARQGFRTVSQPMLQALSLWFIFAGLRRSHHSRVWIIAGGILGGMGLYTYQASRLFPVWTGFMLLILVLTDHAQHRRRLIQSAVILLVMGLVALPMAVYALEHRDIFMDRLDQLSTGDDTPTYLESVWLHVKMFFIEGDPYIRYNEPYKPYFDPLTGLFMVFGLGVSIGQALRGRDSIARSAYGLVACAPLMVLPSILAVGGMPPSNMRSIGMVPMIFFLPALGITYAGEALYSRLTSRAKVPPIERPRILAAISTADYLLLAAWIALLVMAGWVWSRYVNWATNPALFYMADGDMVAAGNWLEEHQDADPLMYVTSLHYDHPSLQMSHLPADRLTYLTGDRLFLPPADRTAYLLEMRVFPLSGALRSFLADFIREDGPIGPDGQPMFTIYRWEPGSVANELPESEPFGGWLTFAGADLPEAAAGTTVTIFSQWRILASPGYDDLTPIFQLETPYGDVLAHDEPFTQGSTRWRPGETLVQQAVFDIPAGTPRGDYPVRVAWVGRAADQYVGRIDPDGHFAGIWLDLGTLTILQPEAPPPAWQVEIPGGTPTNLGSNVRLLGWSNLPDTIRPGESPQLDLIWQTLASAPDVGPLRITAVANDGQVSVLWVGDPVMDTYPFADWRDGEIVVDRHRWRLPTDMRAGDYSLNVELLDGESVEIGKITVLELNRLFDPPAVEHPLDLTFGSTIRLAGYDWAVEGADVRLTLYWQSIAQTDLPLTVFVHLVGPNGNVDQRDAQPRANGYPAALWLPGEYVDDTYTLVFPPEAPTGVYTLRVGLYLQATGQRLSIVGPDGSALGDAWTIAEIKRP